jgi:amyloid beta precursor protein binding protein 1
LSDILQSLSSVSLLLYTYPLTSYDHGVIDEFSQHNGIPIIAIHSAGFYSYFRLYLPALFPIIETHLDLPPVLDLRLYNPWPELSSFLAQLTKDINSADDHTHSHIPFVAIVVHYLDAWKRNHGGRLPTTSRDKTSFRDILQSATRVHGPAGFEENFGEAITMLQRVLAEPALPQGLREAFNLLDQEISLREDRSHFWTLCRGLKSFYELHNHLPLSGRIPDMKAQSQVYVDLQRIYKQKAARDADEVSKLIIDEDKCSLPQTTEVTLFCQNAFAIRVIPPSKPHSTVHGQEPVPMPSRFIDQIARSDPQSVLPIYVVLRAISYVKAPATINDVMKLVSKLVPDVELHDGIVDIAQHIIRAQAAELHNISSITGGLVAQEAIKILTRQYVPIDNTCIFDGIRSRCGVLRI